MPVEDHYVVSPPDTVLRVGDRTRRVLLSSPWAGVGGDRTAAAAVILADATGHETRRPLVAAFANDLLSFPGHPQQLLIAVREVRAWCEERAPEVDARAAARGPFSLPALLAERDRDIAVGPRPGWLTVYRTVHGEPDLGQGTSSDPRLEG